MTADLQTLADHWRDRLTSALDLTLVSEQEFTLLADGSTAGSLRVYEGAARVVDSRLVVSDQGIDSVMLHAFSNVRTPAPHLMSDVASLQGVWHVHADLIPRVDLVTEPVYLDTVYPPLESAIESAQALEGAEEIQSPRRLQALSSPWHVGVKVASHHAGAIDVLHRSYQDQWLDHVDGTGLVTSYDAEQLVARDLAHRSSLFSPTTDPVWEYLESLIGQESVDAIVAAALA